MIYLFLIIMGILITFYLIVFLIIKNIGKTKVKMGLSILGLKTYLELDEEKEDSK